ncbi:MAG: hypothetical protein N4A35_10635 [Flavobacteriales bacterium]|jgi:hypothetical protein|nr:hypothetical protein [Flavobacteriales bacterium]
MKFILLIILAIYALTFKAQDTIYVYDTVFVYDTIRVYDTISLETTEPLKRFEKNAIIIDSSFIKNNDTLSATILNNSIIVDKTIQNIKAMKKVNLFGVMLIALQNITLAQHDAGIQFGLQSFGTNDNVKTVTNPISPGLKLGIFYIHNFNEQIGIETGVNYLYNINNRNASTNSLSTSSINYKQAFNNETSNINNFDITKYKSQIAIPVLLNYKLGNITPKVGIEWRYKTYRKDLVFDRFIYDIGLKAGLSKTINQHLKVEGLFYQGLSNEQDVFQDIKLRSYSLGASISYNL